MSFPNGEVTCPLITVNPVLGFNSITENDLQICLKMMLIHMLDMSMVKLE
jgi:hypothetical protein